MHANPNSHLQEADPSFGHIKAHTRRADLPVLYDISHLIARQLTQHPGLLSSAMTSLGLHMTLPKIPWDTKRFPWKPVWTGRWTQPRDWSRFLTPWETDWQRMRPHRRRSFASGGKGHTHSKTSLSEMRRKCPPLCCSQNNNRQSGLDYKR